jgi:hypothetical protein
MGAIAPLRRHAHEELVPGDHPRRHRTDDRPSFVDRALHFGSCEPPSVVVAPPPPARHTIVWLYAHVVLGILVAAVTNPETLLLMPGEQREDPKAYTRDIMLEDIEKLIGAY